MDTQTIAEAQGLRLHITGVVQGVGFRPFVYGLARRLGPVSYTHLDVYKRQLL